VEKFGGQIRPHDKSIQTENDYDKDDFEVTWGDAGARRVCLGFKKRSCASVYAPGNSDMERQLSVRNYPTEPTPGSVVQPTVFPPSHRLPQSARLYSFSLDHSERGFPALIQ